MSSLLETLPDELVQHLLHYVPPEDILQNFSLLSKRLHRVAQEPLLWRYYCRTTFKYWNSDHRLREKLRRPVHHVDWKGLFLLRLRRNARAAVLLDGIIESRVLRLQKMEQICLFGYDVKDFLLAQCQVDESAEDFLARRHYSCTVLDSIHRGLAIDEWANYQRHEAQHFDEKISYREQLNCGMRLERALGGFDMFMLHDNEGDLDEITELVDHITSQFCSAYPDLHTLTTRQKAITLAQWLHSNNLTGLSGPEYTYHYLRNCLIGRALRDDPHPSLPIISAAIYCSIASRVNIEAYCCVLTNHVHAIVLSPPGISLDGHPLPADEAKDQEKMFMDPFGSDEEVPLDQIQKFLSRLGASIAQNNLLVPTPTDVVVMHTAQSIRASFTSLRTIERPLSQSIPMIELNRGDWARNLQPALYSMIWASIMMVPILPDDEDARWDWQQDVRDLLTYFYEYFPEDAWLVEKYVCPMYDTFAGPGRRQNGWDVPSRRVREQIREIRRVDAAVKAPRRRSQFDKSKNVKYRVGQVFRHRRYDYHGLILGWTVDGPGGSMGWDDGGRFSPSHYSQPFYRCMVGTDGSDHHVIAEENIEVVDFHGGIEVLPPEIQDLIPTAGKFFKRWDGERGVFVSNLRDLYPDD